MLSERHTHLRALFLPTESRLIYHSENPSTPKLAPMNRMVWYVWPAGYYLWEGQRDLELM